MDPAFCLVVLTASFYLTVTFAIDRIHQYGLHDIGFLYSQLIKSLPYPTEYHAGKTIVITGSNVGLGKEAARHYARLGASRLILAVRNLDLGHEAKNDIERSTGCGKEVIQIWRVDMASYDSVKRFAARVHDELDRLDIFHANAGLARKTYGMAEDNEEMISVNVVSTFLLVMLVLPKLKYTATTFHVRPTLSITTSGTYRHTTFAQKAAPNGGIYTAVNDRQTAQKHGDDQYLITKLLGIFAVHDLAERHPAVGIMLQSTRGTPAFVTRSWDVITRPGDSG